MDQAYMQSLSDSCQAVGGVLTFIIIAACCIGILRIVAKQVSK